LIEHFEQVTGEKVVTVASPLPERYYPELDTTSELDEKGHVKFQWLIGCLQWIVTLGHFSYVSELCPEKVILRCWE
jgi:hypothetical protein